MPLSSWLGGSAYSAREARDTWQSMVGRHPAKPHGIRCTGGRALCIVCKSQDKTSCCTNEAYIPKHDKVWPQDNLSFSFGLDQFSPPRNQPIRYMGVVRFVFMLSNFHQLDSHDETCVALVNLRGKCPQQSDCKSDFS